MKHLPKFALAIAAATLAAGITACSSDEPAPEVQNETVEFQPSLVSPVSRLADTKFESGEAISVWAMKSTNGVAQDLNLNNCYATNRQYIFNGTRFVASGTAIEKTPNEALNYFAAYPYSTSYGETFTFKIQEDQTTKAAYDASDLCVAKTGAITSSTADLSFNHAMAQVVIELSADFGTVLNVTLPTVMSTAICEFNAWQIEGTEPIKSVNMNKTGLRSFRAIIAPCNAEANTLFAVIETTNGKFNYRLEKQFKFATGTSTLFQLSPATDEAEAVTISGTVAPWTKK